MKKRLIPALALTIVAAAFAGAAAACASKGGETAKYELLVTYNYNVSHMDASAVSTQYLGLKNKGDYAVCPGFDRELFKNGSLMGYYLEGWYEPLTDGEGNPVDADGDFFRLDKDGLAVKTDGEGYLLAPDGETYLRTENDLRVLLNVQGMFEQEQDHEPYATTRAGNLTSPDGKRMIKGAEGENLVVTRVKVAIDREKKWTFSSQNISDKKVYENLTLYANFVESPKIIVRDGDENEVASYFGDPGSKAIRPNRNPAKEGFTFYGFYEDKEFSEPFGWDYFYPTPDQIQGDKFEDKIIYAKYLEGSWTIVNTEAEFNSALSRGANIWLESNLNFTEHTPYSASYSSREYNGSINGNNHVILGVSIEINAQRGSAGGFGIFGTLGASAHIYDITYEQANLSVSTMGTSQYYAGLFAGVVRDGAKLENVTVSGKLTIGDIADPQLFEATAFIGKNEGAEITGGNHEDITLEGWPKEGQTPAPTE